MSAEVLHFFGVMEAPNRIRELRKQAGMSQQALGDLIHVSKVTISDLELGRMQLTLDYMQRIARALQIATADLLPHTDNPDALSVEERQLIERRREADAAGREQLDKVADVLLPWKGPNTQKAANAS